ARTEGDGGDGTGLRAPDLDVFEPEARAQQHGAGVEGPLRDEVALVFHALPVVVTPSVSEGPGGMGGAPPVPPGPSLTLGMTGRARYRAIAASYFDVFSNTATAQRRRKSSLTSSICRRSSSYSDGSQSGRTCWWFFAAARSIDGPPMSICSTASATVTPSFAIVASNG